LKIKSSHNTLMISSFLSRSPLQWWPWLQDILLSNETETFSIKNIEARENFNMCDLLHVIYS